VPGGTPVGGEESGMHRTVYRQADVDGLSVFYREADPLDKPGWSARWRSPAR
jgi:hypothetical protein